MVLETVFALVLYDAVARDGTSLVRKLSEHQTEQECDTALTKFVKMRESTLTEGQDYNVLLACQKVVRVNVAGRKPRPDTWAEWFRKH